MPMDLEEKLELLADCGALPVAVAADGQRTRASWLQPRIRCCIGRMSWLPRYAGTFTKMKAFVCFRKITDDAGETYVAWFEPGHHIVEATAPFFTRHFSNMRWSILTPRCCALWDGTTLTFAPGVGRDEAPAADCTEDLGRRYYASIFNPARLNEKAMRAQMPRCYWHNLPEAALIPSLSRAAAGRTQAILAAGSGCRAASTEQREAA